MEIRADEDGADGFYTDEDHLKTIEEDVEEEGRYGVGVRLSVARMVIGKWAVVRVGDKRGVFPSVGFSPFLLFRSFA